jgi:hypothetical protein
MLLFFFHTVYDQLFEGVDDEAEEGNEDMSLMAVDGVEGEEDGDEETDAEEDDESYVDSD